MIEAKTVTTEHEIEPVSGTLEGGELIVSEVSINGRQLALEEEKSWDDIEDVNDLPDIIPSITDLDTCSKDYTDPMFITEGTIMHDVLRNICRMFPVTSGRLEEEIDIDHTVTAYTSDLKDKNLVACIGHDTDNRGAELLVPTHVGMKEIYLIDGVPNNEKGLKNLFDYEEGQDKEELET